jgi:hypothetical protein
MLDEHAGSWRIAPSAAARVSRRYLDATNVLETRFDTDTGSRSKDLTVNWVTRTGIALERNCVCLRYTR